MFDPVALHADLQRQQQGEEKLVFLVQATCCVLIHLKSHELYDVGDAFAGDWAFEGPGKKVYFHSRHLKFSRIGRLVAPWSSCLNIYM